MESLWSSYAGGLNAVMSEPPRPAPGPVIFRGTHPACQRSPSCDTWPQDTQPSQWRGRQGGSAQRTPAVASRSLSLGWAWSSSNRQRPGELIKASVPRVFTGGWSHDTLRLTHSEIPDFQKDSRCPDNWSTEGTSFQFWEQREVSQNPSSRTSLRGLLGRQAFLRTAAPGWLW